MTTIHRFSVMLIACLLLISGSTFAQRNDTAKIKAFLSKLKVGEWVELEGMAQRDMTIILEEVEIVYGEVEDDDWEINGKLNRVIPEKKTAYMLNLPIVFDENVEYQDELNELKAFSGLRSGMVVEIEGTYTQEGNFLANEIGQIKLKKADEANDIEFSAKVEAIDIDHMTITALGHLFIMNKDTKIKTVIFD